MILISTDIVNAMMIPFSQAVSYPYDTRHDNDMTAVWVMLAYISIVMFIMGGLKLRRHLRSRKGKKVLRSMSNSKRNKELAKWAQLKGLRLDPHAGLGLAGRYRHLHCFQRGVSYSASNVIEGIIHNRKVCAFDCYWETANYDGEGNLIVDGRYYFSAVVAETDFQLKPLIIRTEKILDKIAASAGLHDIDFESMEFNKKFYVKSSDRRWAYDVVNPATMELLLSSCRFNLEFNGKYVIVYRDELIPVGYFDEALQLLTGVVDNLPRP